MTSRQSRSRSARTGWRAERGSAAPALELIIITPALILLVLVGIAAGRASTGTSRVQQAAAAAARAATQHDTPDQATVAANRVATDSLAEAGVDCRQLRITVDTSGFATPPGQPAHITVTVHCVVAWSDLALPGWPGSHDVTATGVSPHDAERETP
jgi:Flp pilus assembly protein TadG